MLILHRFISLTTLVPTRPRRRKRSKNWILFLPTVLHTVPCHPSTVLCHLQIVTNLTLNLTNLTVVIECTGVAQDSARDKRSVVYVST